MSGLLIKGICLGGDQSCQQIEDRVRLGKAVLIGLHHIQILKCSAYAASEYVKDTVRAGARGYLLKDLPAQDLAYAVRAVSRGVYQFDAATSERMIGAFDGPHTTRKSEAEERLTPALPARAANAAPGALNTAGLTNREVEMLRLIARGLL